jgi:hypothetical protein
MAANLAKSLAQSGQVGLLSSLPFHGVQVEVNILWIEVDMVVSSPVKVELGLGVVQSIPS